MPIIGMRFNAINASRLKSEITGEVKINSTPRILSVKEITIPALKKKALTFGFEFVTKYEPGFGEIKITGEIFYTSEKMNKIIDFWKKKKKLPQEIDIELLNHLFRQCLLKISNIAEDLQLPPPLRFPVVRPKEEQTSYIG